MNQAEASLGKRADAVTNRARLLEAALVVFARSGLDLEVHEIASRAQVGVGTLYRHFGNRENLLRAIVAAIVEDAFAQIERAVQPYADDPRGALRSLVSAGLQIQQQYQSVFWLIRDPRLSKLFEVEQREAMRTQFLDQAKGIIERGIQGGLFREDLYPELAAAMIFGSLSGVFEYLKHASIADLEPQLFHLLWTMLARNSVC